MNRYQNNWKKPPDPPEKTGAAQRGLVWAGCQPVTSCKINPPMANSQVKLRDIGLNKFAGVYSASKSLVEIMRDIEGVMGIRTSHVAQQESGGRVSVRFNVGDVWVCDGIGADVEKAKVDAINNSVVFLMKIKHLPLFTQEHVPGNAVYRIEHGQIASVEATNGFQGICDMIDKRMKKFLANPDLIKIEFPVGDLPAAVEDRIHSAAESYKLFHRIEIFSFRSRAISCWKVNSVVHNLTTPATASKKKRKTVPRGRRNNVINNGNREVLRPQDPRGRNPVINTETGEVLRPDHKVVMSSEKYPDSNGTLEEYRRKDTLDILKLAADLSKSLLARTKGEVKESIVNSLPPAIALRVITYLRQDEQLLAYSEMIPYDETAINPEALAVKNLRQFLPGYLLFSSILARRPEYLLRVSKLSCDYYSIRYEKESDSDFPGSVLVRLFLKKADKISHRAKKPLKKKKSKAEKKCLKGRCIYCKHGTCRVQSNKDKVGQAVVKTKLYPEKWLCTGRGASFEEAREVCATNAVNFMLSRGIYKYRFKLKQWNIALDKYDGSDCDLVWEISRDELQSRFILSTSYPKMSEYDPSWELLERLGWTQGSGLGKYSQGRVDPIQIWRPHYEYRGLGFDTDYGETGPKPELTNCDDELIDLLVAFKNNPDVIKLVYLLGDVTSKVREIAIMREMTRKLQLLMKTQRVKENRRLRTVIVWKKYHHVGVKFNDSAKSLLVNTDLATTADASASAAAVEIGTADTDVGDIDGTTICDSDLDMDDIDGDRLSDSEEEFIAFGDNATFYCDDDDEEDDDDIDGEYFDISDHLGHNYQADFYSVGEVYNSTPVNYSHNNDEGSFHHHVNHTDNDRHGSTAKDNRFHFEYDSQPGPSSAPLQTIIEILNSVKSSSQQPSTSSQAYDSQPSTSKETYGPPLPSISSAAYGPPLPSSSHAAYGPPLPSSSNALHIRQASPTDPPVDWPGIPIQRYSSSTGYYSSEIKQNLDHG